jgi:hypothetical protein
MDNPMGTPLTTDEASYFLNIAVIGGTLLGLTFVVLAFFLADLFKRYEDVSLPVFRARDASKPDCQPHYLKLPLSLTDEELMDGDPLVVFIAFSVAVTWNLFLLPMTIGLTAAWSGVRTVVLAGELFFFFCVLVFSFIVRNRKIAELRPYLTRDELLWPYIGAVALVLYAASTAVVLIAAFAPVSSAIAQLAFWNRWGITNEHAIIALLKGTCIVALLLGTYTTNKDMFIFFKSVAAERVRQRWLHGFLKDTYKSLPTRVRNAEAHGNKALREIWNGGYPRHLNLIAIHRSLREADIQVMHRIWDEIVRREQGTPSWMIDVPGIAAWAAQVEHCISFGGKVQSESSAAGAQQVDAK